VLLVAGAGFLHFMADLWGYWAKNPHYALSVTGAVAALVVISIVAGFFIIGTPGQARQQRLDDQRVSDLMNIQWQVVSYWQQKQKLPASINDLEDPISGYSNPRDPETGEPYAYRPGEGMSFSLCATFSGPSNANRQGLTMPMGAGALEGDWKHGAGETCFERTIDPERYPPTPNPNTKPIPQPYQ
jgi:type II secretory pathway pseudopilin PulG